MYPFLNFIQSTQFERLPATKICIQSNKVSSINSMIEFTILIQLPIQCWNTWLQNYHINGNEIQFYFKFSELHCIHDQFNWSESITSHIRSYTSAFIWSNIHIWVTIYIEHVHKTSETNCSTREIRRIWKGFVIGKQL